MTTIRDELLALAPPEAGLEDPAYKKLATRLNTAADAEALRSLITPWEAQVINYDEPSAWLPVHAWRVLALQENLTLLEPLLQLCDHPDDYLAYGEFGPVAAKLGPTAVDPLAAVLNAPDRSELQRILAAQGLAAIAEAHPTEKPAAIEALKKQLEAAIPGEGDLSAVSTEALIKLRAVQVGDLVRSAHKAGLINLGIGADDLLDAAFPKKS